MATLTYGVPAQINIADISRNLLDDLSEEGTCGWNLYEATAYDGDYVSGQCLQIVFKDGRAGIVFCGSGSSGHTEWTDADSPEDALRRYLEDDMSN